MKRDSNFILNREFDRQWRTSEDFQKVQDMNGSLCERRHSEGRVDADSRQISKESTASDQANAHTDLAGFGRGELTARLLPMNWSDCSCRPQWIQDSRCYGKLRSTSDPSSSASRDCSDRKRAESRAFVG